MRFVWRHLPLTDVHPEAELAAQAAEAAGDAGQVLGDARPAARPPGPPAEAATCSRYAEQLGLDVPRFSKELYSHVHAGRVAQDVESADISGVSGTPTFFVNGRRHYGAFDAASLTQAIATDPTTTGRGCAGPGRCAGSVGGVGGNAGPGFTM